VYLKLGRAFRKIRKKGETTRRRRKSLASCQRIPSPWEKRKVLGIEGEKEKKNCNEESKKRDFPSGRNTAASGGNDFSP